ncbi:glycosyltransferase family 4 protein [Nocardioides marmorisolisilvae]|uniref:Glycosyltransferase WbuB n=1 Tax=Nocardioides marmorisolisilvae TaxID=1542737 RepID=A0A3N0DIK2_9ACTN|nr:glycosyltransferase family 4 protein [Nocardioides marmorisolisilvae]RNL75514.1 glycosyltransferase WbuB [Nocardioides marmorisolisilvae]
MSLRFRVKRVIRRQAATASAKLPAGGPLWWRRLVERAQVAEARRLIASKDLAPARGLLKPHVDRSAPLALAVLAELDERAGDYTAALTAARAAVAGDAAKVPFDARLVHYRLAVTQGEQDEVAASLAALVDTRPRRQRQAVLTFEALRSATPADVDRFRDHLVGWKTFRDTEELTELHDETRAELELLAASDAELDALVAAVDDRLRRPLPVVARALDQRREWARLADYAERRTANAIAIPVRRKAALELRKAASRALTAGYTEPAQRLAAQALARHPDDRFAQQTWANAADQLLVVREGWNAPTPAARPAYEPRPRAVLAMLAQSLPWMSGGYATRTHGIMTGLANHGWDVEGVTRLGFPYDRWTMLDPRRVEDFDEVDGIKYHRVLAQTAPGPYPQHPLAGYVDRYAQAIVQHARRHRPALLQSSSFHVNGMATRQAAAKLGIPYVYEMRGLEDLMKVSRDPEFRTSDRQHFLDTVELASCMGAERVFVITEALRREMAERGVPEEKLVVLPNGVHTNLFQPRERDAELEAELGLQGKTVIGYAGGMVDYEGLELLLEAVAELRERRRGPDGSVDFHLVIVGSGPHQPVVQATAERLRLGDVLTFTGRVPHEEVSRYLSLFDITPFPRLPLPVCELISPIKPFESLAMGKAVIVSSVAALTEIVNDEVTGLVFEKGSSTDLARVIERYIDDPGLRAAMGERARSWVLAERDWSKLVDIMSAEYEKILG